MKDQTNLALRGTTFWFRCRVPADLVKAYGKNEISFSLRTKDKKEPSTSRLALKDYASPVLTTAMISGLLSKSGSTSYSVYQPEPSIEITAVISSSAR